MENSNNSYAQGQCIHTAPPYAHILCEAERGSRCDFCLKSPEKLLRCSSCTLLRYCDGECQKADWKFHKEECKHLKRLAPKVPTDSMRLFYRLMLRNQWGDHMSIREEFGNISRTFNDLMTHTEEIKKDRERVEAFMTMCTMLQAFTSNKFDFPPAVEAIAVFGRMMVNSFSICDSEMKPVGIGVYLGPSVLDHSCEPNAVVTFVGSELRVHCVAENPITIEEARISYVELLSPHEERQLQLNKQYYFTCTCQACEDKKGDELMLSSQCPECEGPISQNQDEEFLPCKKCGYSSFNSEYGTKNYTTVSNARQAFEQMKRQHKDEEYERLLEIAEEQLKKQKGILHPYNVHYVRTLDKAMDGAIGLGDMEKAVCYGKQNIEPYRHYYPHYHPNLGLHLLKLGKICLYLQQHQTALQHLHEALPILVVTHGDDHPLLRDVHSLLEQCQQESTAESE